MDEANLAAVLDDLTAPWHRLEPNAGGDHERELQLELPGDHPLHGVHVTAVAVHDDEDDVLFACFDLDAAITCAIVHLTWSRRREVIPYPHTVLCTTEATLRQALAEI